uniref:SpaF n=1 Tax=Spirochaeta aurantia TaxID=147 RepID=Q0PI02_SPIAU|nr:SpaF [Spirochaeta aurantia]
MIRALFFDLDGTLVDTHQANFVAYRQALEAHGVTVTEDEFRKCQGHQARVFLRWFLPDMTPEVYRDIAQRKSRLYAENLDLTLVNDHLLGLLRAVCPDTTCAIVTTATRTNSEAVLRHHGLADRFSFMVTADDVQNAKPHPEGYLLALARANVPAADALAFEDSRPGIEAAEAAGLAVVHIANLVP